MAAIHSGTTGPLTEGTLLREKYRIMRLVAGGGMAWIYQIREVLPDGNSHIWALKELRAQDGMQNQVDEAQDLFEQEANILVRLAHPNLPRVAAYFQERGRSYLVMEFVTGESLQKSLEKAQAPLLEDTVIDWAVQVCDVLEYLHTRSQPVIFRDLKPSNIMVTPQGIVKLIDFGIARTYKAGKRQDTVTMGSENYAAPEQWGKTQTDPRADIYSLGATLYHLLANIAPLPAFVPETPVPARTYNPAISEEMASVIEKAMEPQRAHRYQSAQAMRADLLACLPWIERQRCERRTRTVQAQARRMGQFIPEPTATIPPAAPNTVTEPGLAKPIQMILCPVCRAANRANAQYCMNCGRVLAERVRGLLRILQTEATGTMAREYPLQDKFTLVGRRGGDLPVDIDLGTHDPHGYISRNHCRIVYNDRYYLIALPDTNGTYINGKKLEPRQPYPLQSGDRVRMGRVLVVFETR